MEIDENENKKEIMRKENSETKTKRNRGGETWTRRRKME